MALLRLTVWCPVGTNGRYYQQYSGPVADAGLNDGVDVKQEIYDFGGVLLVNVQAEPVALCGGPTDPYTTNLTIRLKR